MTGAADRAADPVATVAVIGLGKIGLPLAVRFAASGLAVTGVDIDPDVVATVSAGHEPFPGEAGLADGLRTHVDRGALAATADTEGAVRGSDAVVVVVPLVVDAAGRPDFSGIDAATTAVGRGLRPGTLVTYETTLPVGTTRTRFGPALAAASGLRVGVDFDLAFSPERVSSGRVFLDLATYPKLVGGTGAGSGPRAAAFYGRALGGAPVQELADAETAEFAKLAETTYRDVAIALSNQFAMHAEQAGVDYPAVVEACNSQPFSHLHAPGIAVGGHCIPVYPHFYLASDPTAALVRTARVINEGMPEHAVARLEARFGKLRGARVAVLGVAYRGGVKETAFSGAFAVVAALRERGALVTVHDPLYADDELRALGLEPHRRGEEVDAAVVHTDHREYADLVPADLPGARVVLDGRNVVSREPWDPAVLLGIGRAG